MVSFGPYQERIDRVIDYIYDHLDQPIDLNRMAEVACLSPYHWHRIYQSIRGETVAATVKRLRLHRAAGDLANTTRPIREVAKRWGYPNLQSFTRIFRSTYGLPPADYRRNGNHARYRQTESLRRSTMFPVEIKTLSALTLATVDHRGSYMEISRAFERLFGWLGPRGLIGDDMRMIALYYDTPDSVPESELRSKAGATVDGRSLVESPVSLLEMPGGPHAVLMHRGPYAAMKIAYQWLFGVWLPESGYEAADAPAFEEYLNTPLNAAHADLLTAIHLPLKV